MGFIETIARRVSRCRREAGAEIVSIHPDGSLARIEAQRWADLPALVQRRLVSVYQTRLSADERIGLAAFVRSRGEDWATQDTTPPVDRAESIARYDMHVPSSFHFGPGMWLRNLLREHGVLDRDVPTGNLDDYYVRAIEEAVRDAGWPKVVWYQGELESGYLPIRLIEFAVHADRVIGKDGTLLKDGRFRNEGQAVGEKLLASATVIW